MGIFNDTITVYNHRPDDTYQRTVLCGVMYARKAEKTVTADGKLKFVSSVTVTIPETAVTAPVMRIYVPPERFRQLDDAAEDYWTLDPAGNLDVIVPGACGAEISEDYRLKDLKKDHPYATVAAVSDNRGRNRLKHIRVKCNG